jgi:hypothetical protein
MVKESLYRWSNCGAVNPLILGLFEIFVSAPTVDPTGNNKAKANPERIGLRKTFSMFYSPFNKKFLF